MVRTQSFDYRREGQPVLRHPFLVIVSVGRRVREVPLAVCQFQVVPQFGDVAASELRRTFP